MGVSLAEARGIALGLAGSEEKDHHGRASFRVRGKIYATVPDPTHLNVMLDDAGIRAAVDRWPETCDFVHWGAKLAAVSVDLEGATVPMLTSLLGDAHARRA